jgi:ribonucleoside-diphosphate reductase beta chain
MYQVLIDTLVSEEETKDKLFNSVKDIECIKKKAEWARKWIKEGSFVQRLVAFSIVEGIFFSGSFCSIFWLRKRGLMPGLGVSNEWISRDEGMHWQFAAELYKHLGLNLSRKEILDIVKEAVEIEKEFVTEALPVSLIGMNSKLMGEYIEYVADRLLVTFDQLPLYGAKNPFDFMVLLDVDTKTNFFEKRVTSYQRGADRNISLSEAF